jgi:hypothetical protein
MESIRCPKCGLTYWRTASSCKRCGAPASPAPVAQSYAAPAPGFTSHAPAFAANFSNGNDETKRAGLLKNIKRDTRFFYVIGGLQIVAWFVIGNLLIVDGLLNICATFLVHKFKSRTAAGFLLLLTLLSIVVGIKIMTTGAHRPGAFMPLGMLARLLTSIRMLYSTCKLREFPEMELAPALPPPPPVFYQETAAPQWASPNAGGAA